MLVMAHLQQVVNILTTYFLMTSFMASIIGTVPADRYMPPSWSEMCQADVSPLQSSQMTSHTFSDVNNAPFPLGSGYSLQNPFLKPHQDQRQKTESMESTLGNDIGTTIPTNQISTQDNNNNNNKPTSTGNPVRTKMNNITCKIYQSNHNQWKLMDLHNWQTANGINAMTSPSNRTVVFSISVQCETGANISLPWPMKSKGLREVRVRNCGLVDQFALANNPLVSLIPDELRVLDIRDSFWLVDLNSKNSILENTATDFLNLHSDYDCGQDDSLELYISRNVTFTSYDTFNKISLNSSDFDNVENSTLSGKLSSQDHTTKRPIRPEDRLITNQEALISDRHTLKMDKIPNFDDVIYNENTTDDLLTNLTAKQDFFDLLKKIKNTRIQCDFVKLLVRDESLSSDTPRHLLEVSTQEATHPVLEVLNYSSVGMIVFPRELSQWRLYFPRLMYLDLSHNHISEIEVADYPLMPDSPRTVINIRHNNMTKISPDILKSWASVDKFHVDLMHNPISCDCDLKLMISFIQDELSFTGNMKQYEYIKYLHCNSPASLKGKKLITLDEEDLPCITFESSNGLVITLAVLLGTFIILTILLIRFKVEIRILLYTRLHLRLPCDSDAQRNNKRYDAFVSYSNEDSNWVLHNLVNYLEKDATNSVNGAAQNGVQKYSNSNHPTVLNGSVAGVNRRSKDTADHNGFKLCLHQRDFIPGKTIVDNIVDCIEASRHTIIVLSPSFMRSHWAMEELRQAYRQSLVEKTRHLIVVLLEKVPDQDMDPLIRRCVQTFTYLQVQDSIFKDKLVFSLSTKDRATRRRDRLASKQMAASYCQPANRSASEKDSNAHENFTYIHESSPSSPHSECNQRAWNEYETIQQPISIERPSQTNHNTKTNNNKEIFLQHDYYSFPSRFSDVTSSSTPDNGYYSLELPMNSAHDTVGSYGYENPADLKGSDNDKLRPEGPARVLSNSSTSSTTALTWNL